jgi:GNAT superfamily N-acetyltransferase
MACIATRTMQVAATPVSRPQGAGRAAVEAWCRACAQVGSAGGMCVYVASMAVRPSHRRRGIASSLLAAAEQQARLWGQPLVALQVGAPALALAPPPTPLLAARRSCPPNLKAAGRGR